MTSDTELKPAEAMEAAPPQTYCFKNLKVMLDENLKILDGLTLGRSWLNIQPPGFSSQKLSLQIKTLSLSLIVPAAVKLVSVAM